MVNDTQYCLWLVLLIWKPFRMILVLFCLSIIVYVYQYNVFTVRTSMQYNITVLTHQSFSYPGITNVNSLLFEFANNMKYGNSNKTREDIQLLTLFTTWPQNDTKSKERILTLKNWAQLKPHVRPVFFSSRETNTTYIRNCGWDVLPVTKTAASGVPVLKHMYMEVMLKFKSIFYGYSNGDILFDAGLLDTLLTVASASIEPKKPILIIGRRTNVMNVSAKESDVGSLGKIAKKRGKLFLMVAEDYFITDSSFPWADIPGIVIGRRAYDNWIVLNSCKQKHTVIDASDSLLAMHQTTKAGNFEGLTHRDSNYNAELLYDLYTNIPFAAGSTTCAPLETLREGNETHNKVLLSQRKTLKSLCYPY